MDGLVIDNFAGGGGASTGIAWAIGRDPDIAINHKPQAIAMHRANHPTTRHLTEDVWAVDPAAECAGRPVALAWFSPDCTHFSRAKGGKPRSKKTRALAWVVIRWARTVRPRVIMLENVEEFLTWGPVNDDGAPCRKRAGRTFRMWAGKLRGLGYDVQWRSLVAADYGAPTTRKRLFLIARCDGERIVWPEPTHGRHRPHPWKPASSVIDWSLPCPSIFERKRPLADATLRRIAAGLRRYVLESPRPFVVHLTHHGQRPVHPIDGPLPTVTGANRGELALVAPTLATVTHTTGGDRAHAITEPLRTITTAKGGEFVLVAPTLVSTGYGEREGQAPRAPGLDKPVGTVVPGGKHAVVYGFLTKHYGKGVYQLPLDLPLGTVTAREHFTAQQVTVEPVAASFVTKFYGTSTGADAREPLPTVTANGRGGGHLAEVRAFLVKYYGSDGSPTSQQQSLFEPLHTVTSKARFGLVTIEGAEYQITDIGMRMLAPRELFAAQSFPPDYVIEAPFRGRKLTKTEQIDLCGNSVCAILACALVRANMRRAPAANDERPEAFTGAA